MDRRPRPCALSLPAPKTACYLPWLKVSLALRYLRTFPGALEARREVRQQSQRCMGQSALFGRPPEPSTLLLLAFGPLGHRLTARGTGVLLKA